MEPSLEKVFHVSSFGYRRGRSAHDALEQCRSNCYKHDWVIDVDIKGFFDTIDHDLMMQLLAQHSGEKWVLLYVERWLKAGVEGENGGITARKKGTPQGGVVSPLLANLYLHHAFDTWMDTAFANNQFERYADDIVIHCASKEEAAVLLERLKARRSEFRLELHPEKTRIVYCKDYRRKGRHEVESFTFLSYTFAPRTIKSKYDSTRMVLAFSAFISQRAKKHIREKIKEVLYHRRSSQSLEQTALRLNPKIRGWINYHAKFNRNKVLEAFEYLNTLIRKWIRNTYKLRSVRRVVHKYGEIVKANPELFYHWKLGMTY